jgi:hypothetical protein
MYRAVIPKFCSADHKWSANPYTNQYFELRGALKCSKWSAHQKSLGSTGLEKTYHFFKFHNIILFARKWLRNQHFFNTRRPKLQNGQTSFRLFALLKSPDGNLATKVRRCHTSKNAPKILFAKIYLF